MAISDRQAAAIRRRKRDKEYDRRQADERGRFGLVGFVDVDPADPDLVGWFRKSADTVKGTGHVCITCQPQPSLTMHPVYRHLLAARMPCGQCGTVLETIGRAVEEK